MRRATLVLSVAVGLVLSAAGASPASAATPAPNWAIRGLALPTHFSAAQNAECIGGHSLAGCNAFRITATDLGAGAGDGSAVTISDAIPSQLTVQELHLKWSGLPLLPGGGIKDLAPQFCTAAPDPTCVLPESFFQEAHRTVQPDDAFRLEILVTVSGGAPDEVLPNSALVQGGGMGEASAEVPASTATADPAFGLTAFRAPSLGLDGLPDTQAADHPYEFHTDIDPTTVLRLPPDITSPAPTAVQDLRDVVVDLPLGFLGSAKATPTCSFAQFVSHISGGVSGCPPDTVVGHLLTEPELSFDKTNAPIYNITPEAGVPAEFAFADTLGGVHALYASVVPTPEGYVLRTIASEIPQILLQSVEVAFYGDPAARDAGREPEGGDVPFFTNPASCSGASLQTKIHLDSWQAPGSYNPDGTPDLSDPDWVSAQSPIAPVTGCNQLKFKPKLEAKPETNQGDSPTGLEVDLQVPQTEDINTLATPPLKKAVVTLPEGMTVNPSSANGLQGCSLAQIGIDPTTHVPDAAAPQCPDASKIGTVELETPSLPGTLHGQIYVAKQTENPFGTLLALYIVVDDPTTGVVVKLPAEVKADPVTGQLSTVVDNSPQFPFSELRTKFFGGQKAALRTPAVCGTYKVTSSLTPWSAPQSGPPATPSSSFKITQGCAESAAEEPHKPSFEAGTVSPFAGAYSPFVLKLHREDGSQELKGLSVTLPPGLIGRLAGLSECPDSALAIAAAKSGVAEQAAPSCPSSSDVGTVTVGAGAGLTPYYATGHAYLAGPYKGAPLSLAIITPAVAGPYDLGDVVVRTALQVDPETTQITAVSDEIPHILQGIPLDVRSIALNMNKPDFTLNPTNCEKKSIVGTATSVLGASAPLSNPFQVGNCKPLGFKPKLQLSLKGSTKHAGHPALKAVLTYPKQGAYANVARAQVNLPHSEFIDQGNLNKTCTKPVLLAGNCPATSIYGKVKAWTPLLAAPLEGPVYLVGGYGYKLPALVAELNGQIRVLLVGKVDSGKNKGIRNTFESVPDAPVEKFVLELKGGPKYSLLENSENLCAKPQKAIADFTAQSGRVLHLTPTITNGCKGKGKKGGKHGKKQKGKKGKGAGGHGKSSNKNADRLELSALTAGW